MRSRKISEKFDKVCVESSKVSLLSFFLEVVFCFELFFLPFLGFFFPQSYGFQDFSSSCFVYFF